ncbi:hypothetical protein P8X24_10920 [Pyrococcus kukulkanii]|uniref:hypothetical protein n=1 Tax=Pyrococcus kukulkanii TaxID=1609559 RepID=UPI00356742E5
MKATLLGFEKKAREGSDVVKSQPACFKADPENEGLRFDDIRGIYRLLFLAGEGLIKPKKARFSAFSIGR